MSRLLIVYHSRTGGTRQMVAAAHEAAKDELETILKPAPDVTIDDMLSADGYIFAAPENLASMSGAMKEFFDQTYYGVLGQIEGRPYAQMICAGSDGENAARQIARIATGWRLKEVQPPLIVCTHAQTEAQILAQKMIAASDLEKCRDLGAALAAGIALGVF